VGYNANQMSQNRKGKPTMKGDSSQPMESNQFVVEAIIGRVIINLLRKEDRGSTCTA
jgi:hypothetical protein